MEFRREQLQTMKRAELQKICKKFGVRANMKTEKLIEELIEHYSTTTKKNVKDNSPECNEVPILIPEKNEQIMNDMNEPKKIETEEKDNKPVKRKSGNKTKKLVKAPSKIPRLNSNATNMKLEHETPINNGTTKTKTPKRNEPKDWSKIHQRQFEKMDSLDVYLSKKRKRAEELGTSAKKVKVLTDEKPQKARAIKVVERKKSEQAKVKSSVATPKLEPNKQKRLTFNFVSSTMKENKFQTPGAGKRRTIASVNDHVEHKPVTPFRFTSSNTLPFGSPTPKPKFDLKASLARTLPYKPYTGKLRTPPYARQATPKVVSIKKNKGKPSHQKGIKAVKTTSRVQRRQRQMKSQSRARESAVSRRRGMVN